MLRKQKYSYVSHRPWWPRQVFLAKLLERLITGIKVCPPKVTFNQNKYYHNLTLCFSIVWLRSLYWRGRVSTLDLLVLTRSDHLILILKIFFVAFYKTSFLNEKVNCTEPSSYSVKVPWGMYYKILQIRNLRQINRFNSKLLRKESFFAIRAKAHWLERCGTDLYANINRWLHLLCPFSFHPTCFEG